MPQGFFKTSTFTARAENYTVPRCNQCRLYEGCHSPKMEVTGKGQRKILILGEAPGANEDAQGIQFCGKAGNRLQSTLRMVGIDMREDCWLTNSLICRPPSNATPNPKQLAWCKPNLTKTIARLKPHVIVPLGAVAVRQLLTGIWREDMGAITRWVGWRIPDRSLNTWICPTWHPSYLLRQNDQALDLWFTKHWKRILKLSGRPYGEKGPLPLGDKIERILDPAKAASRIRSMMLLGDFPAAFDYETNMLKPDHKKARIVSCSISWEGRTTIAYPWMGEAIEATKEFLASPAPKIASNQKYEDRWTRKKLKMRVNNWHWDTMDQAHVLDNRPGITSIKFQAYVRLGFPVYDAKIKPFLKAKGSNELNRIREVDLDQLLMYNGLDSLLEFKVYEDQKKEMG